MRRRWILGLAGFLLLGLPVLAQDTTLWIGPAVGNVWKRDRHAYGSLEVRRRFFTAGRWSWEAGAALEANSVENYLGVALSLRYALSDRWSLSLTTGPGRYSDRYFDLGSRLEFRSGVELARQLRKGRRVAVGLFHYSNGGTASHNPGTESVRVALVLPLEG